MYRIEHLICNGFPQFYKEFIELREFVGLAILQSLDSQQVETKVLLEIAQRSKDLHEKILYAIEETKKETRNIKVEDNVIMIDFTANLKKLH